MKRVRWKIGAAAIMTLLVATLLYPLPTLFSPDMPYVQFLGRAMYVLLLAAGMCVYRISRGPTAADRIVAVDIFGILIVGFCAILTISSGRSWYMDIAIAWALQSFIGSLALAKYLEGKALEQ